MEQIKTNNTIERSEALDRIQEDPSLAIRVSADEGVVFVRRHATLDVFEADAPAVGLNGRYTVRVKSQKVIEAAIDDAVAAALVPMKEAPFGEREDDEEGEE